MLHGRAALCYGARMNFVRASFLVVAFAFSFVVVQACSGADKCGPSTCLDGCCDEAGRCQQGTVQTACGVAGQACQTCDSQSICQGGVCTSFGGGGDTNVNAQCLQTCSGCCRNGQCVAGNTEQDCGQGEACLTCGTGQVCDSGACRLIGCDGCRDTAGNCVSDGLTSATACGRDGVACRSCPSGSTCVDGSCTGCAGCYDELGRCRTGNVAGACGTAGAACSTCAMGTTCNNGSCQVSCKSLGAGCVSGAECCSGACDNGMCAMPAGDAGMGDGGTGDAGMTDAGMDGGSCKSNGAGCLIAQECCAGVCTNGFCGTAPPTDGGDCNAVPDVCQPSQLPGTPSCDPCIAKVCADDPVCCSTSWDSFCVAGARDLCTGRCP